MICDSRILAFTRQSTVTCISYVHQGSRLWHDLQAASLKIAEQYVGAFGNVAKEVRRFIQMCL